MPATVLRIQHEPAGFRLIAGEASTNPVELPSPYDYPVEGRPLSNLIAELAWYLEEFLNCPFDEDLDHAARVTAALDGWGAETAAAIFDPQILRAAVNNSGWQQLEVQVASDDPGVLSWPWEALRPAGQPAPLGQICRVTRRLNQELLLGAPPDGLPTDRVNILLVVARPFQQDVAYRSLARPLVELIRKKNLPAYVHVLRPPTFDRLREHLEERRGFYHLLHFDGHGVYGIETESGPQGCLVFENEDAKEDLKTADDLAALLHECGVPAVLLNACQSAMVDTAAQHPFASVAGGLLRAGVRSVVAMSYSLYVSGAQRFLPAFYSRLFSSGNLADAVRAGRIEMRAHPGRLCVRGEWDLQDWILPVLYQQEAAGLTFGKSAPRPGPRDSMLPDEAALHTAYGFIGRDSALLDLERAMRRPAAGILIQGLGGVGKTTLARGFLQWLADTEGLQHPPLWLSFAEIRSAEFVLNRMGEAVYGAQFAAAESGKKLPALVRALREHPLVVVWDNFESASGVEGTSRQGNLSDLDRQTLASLLKQLHGGRTKIILTSRGEENWLGAEGRQLQKLGGLDGEERWEYCELILRALKKQVSRDDRDLAELMDLLAGHPLAMRVVLLRMERASAAAVLHDLKTNLAALDGGPGDEEQRRLFATLRFVEEGLPERLRPLLILTGLHETYLQLPVFAMMAGQVSAQWDGPAIETFRDALLTAGLVWEAGAVIYGMHPLLGSYVAARVSPRLPAAERDACARAFVDVLGSLADHFAPRPLHEQRAFFHLHRASCWKALAEAERLEMGTDFAALTQALAAYSQNVRNWAEAGALFARLAEYSTRSGHEDGVARAYGQLGTIAEQQRDFAQADDWYRKSLAIFEKLGNEQGAAITYHQLGIIAEQQRDFAQAAGWYRKSLAIVENVGNEHHAASTYHQLGSIAEEQRDFAQAAGWYRKSLDIFEKLGNEHHAASTYHQLGIIAQEQRDFAQAAGWYRKSLDSKEKLGDEHGAAITYHQLGRIAEEQRDFAQAVGWYRKSLDSKEKLGDEHGAAITYHQLGIIAQEQRDFAQAAGWYRKSLAINEKLGDEHGAALTYGQLGALAVAQQQWLDAGRWMLRALATFLKYSDQHLAGFTLRNYLRIWRNAPPTDQAKLKAMWDEAGFGPFPEDNASAAAAE